MLCCNINRHFLSFFQSKSKSNSNKVNKVKKNTHMEHFQSNNTSAVDCVIETETKAKLIWRFFLFILAYSSRFDKKKQSHIRIDPTNFVRNEVMFFLTNRQMLFSNLKVFFFCFFLLIFSSSSSSFFTSFHLIVSMQTYCAC